MAQGVVEVLELLLPRGHSVTCLSSWPRGLSRMNSEPRQHQARSVTASSLVRAPRDSCLTSDCGYRDAPRAGSLRPLQGPCWTVPGGRCADGAGGRWGPGDALPGRAPEAGGRPGGQEEGPSLPLAGAARIYAPWGISGIRF